MQRIFRERQILCFFYPMKSQDGFRNDLYWFCKEVGLPIDLILDGFITQTKSSVNAFCDQFGTMPKKLERDTSWKNLAELLIGALNEHMSKHMRESNSPMVLWYYAIKSRAFVHNVVPRPIF